MRKQLLLTPALVLALLILFTGCKKDDDPIPVKTKTELITTGTWKFDKALAGGLDVSSNPQLTCYIDNVMTFSTNNTGTISEGAAACTSPAPANFAWSFQSNESLLRFDFALFPGGSTDFTIVSLTETNLVLSQMMTFTPFPPTLVEVTFKH
jgi:hypothetical protein